LTNNTIVLFSSDNGPADIRVEREAGHSGVGSTEPLRGRKRSLYNGGINVPFIVRWPGHIPANRKVSFFPVELSAVDLLPTLLKIAGVSLPSSLVLDGEDVSDIFSGKNRARTKPLFWEWLGYIGGHVLNRSPQLAILDGSWKLLMNPDGSRVELYDFRPWPHDEKQNQAREQPNVVEQLKQKLLTWKATLPQRNRLAPY